MRGIIVTAIAGLVIELFLTAGCDNKDNPAGTQTNKAVGAWKYISGDTTKTLVITADSFTLNVNGDYPLLETGTYTLSGSAINYTFTLCTSDNPPEGIPCPQAPQNTGTISADKITIPDANGGIITLTKQQ